MMNLNDQNVEYGEKLGFGSFGVVRLAKLNGKVVAAKIFNSSVGTMMDKILSEVDKLSAFEHPNIVRCYGLTIRKEPHKDYVMFMEWAEGGTLENFMHGEGWENRNASDVARLNWMLQLANALAYLHDHKVAHRDVSPKNLVLDKTYKTLKLCDFGLVKQLATNNTELIGTITYMAPEVSETKKYTTQCDVFSFGIVLWEVMSNKKPFHDTSKERINALAQQMFINKGERPKLDDVKPYTDIKLIKDIIVECWTHEPKHRPTMKFVAFLLSHDRHCFEYQSNKEIKCQPLPSTADNDIKF